MKVSYILSWFILLFFLFSILSVSASSYREFDAFSRNEGVETILREDFTKESTDFTVESHLNSLGDYEIGYDNYLLQYSISWSMFHDAANGTYAGSTAAYVTNDSTQVVVPIYATIVEKKMPVLACSLTVNEEMAKVDSSQAYTDILYDRMPEQVSSLWKAVWNKDQLNEYCRSAHGISPESYQFISFPYMAWEFQALLIHADVDYVIPLVVVTEKDAGIEAGVLYTLEAFATKVLAAYENAPKDTTLNTVVRLIKTIILIPFVGLAVSLTVVTVKRIRRKRAFALPESENASDTNNDLS